MKLLLNVQVPAIDKKYDILIPDFLPITEVTALIIQAVKEASSNNYKSSGKETLSFKEGNCILAGNATLKTYHVMNGDTIVLI